MPPQEPPHPSASAGQSGRQSIFLIRHGDRWDYSHPEWCQTASRKGDPPLSDLGHVQARETGRFLDSILSNEGILAQDVTLLSSPFLRCVQTSDDILSSFARTGGGVAENVLIKPECSVWEIDGHGGAAHASLPPVEERGCYFPRLDVGHKSLFIPELPENNRDEFFRRIDRAAKALGRTYEIPQREGEKSALVVVTHAAGCVTLAASLSGQELKDINPAPPCGIFRLDRTSSTKEGLFELDHHGKEGGMNGYSRHVTDRGKHTIPWNHFGPKNVDMGYTGPPRKESAEGESVGSGGI